MRSGAGGHRRPIGWVLVVAATGVLVACSTAPLPSPAPSAPTTTSAPDATSPSAAPAPAPAPALVDARDNLDYFGVDHFAFLSADTPLSEFAARTEMRADSCSEQGPFRFYEAPGPPDSAPWVLWASGNDVDATTGESLVTDFHLEATLAADLTGPFGPQGPAGLQLGVPEQWVLDNYPDARVKEYLAAYFNEIYMVHVAQVGDGTVIAMGARDGVIVDIRWGSPDVAEDWVHQRCSEGPAPFDW